MSDVFISYSRLDREFVGQLRDALVTEAQEVWIDWESIPPSQAWWNEIQKGIARANNFVVVLSPHSMASPICQMEIEYARQLKKRIIPVLHIDYNREESLTNISQRLAKKEESTTREIWGARQPHDVFDANDSELKHINYFFFKSDADFQARFNQLFAIIRTDYAHKEQHTTLELRALEWDRRGRDVSFLLIDNELAQAQAWLAAAADKEPAVTALHRAYIEASEKRTQQLRNIRRASIIGSIAAVIAIIFAIGASLLGVQATNSANLASTRESAAGTQVAVANIALTAVPPTLTDVRQQVVTAQEQANIAGTQVADANNALTAVPPTLTEVNQAVVIAQELANIAGTQVSDANNALTAVPPTLTEVNQAVIVAQELANAAGTQVSDSSSALTAIPPTLTEVNAQVISAQEEAAVASTQIAAANQELVTATLVAQQAATGEAALGDAVTQIAQAGATLTPIPPTLTAVAQQVIDGANLAESMRLGGIASGELLGGGSPETAAVFAIRALKTAYSAQADEVLVQALERVHTIRSFSHENLGVLTNVVFSPNGSQVALTGYGRVFVYDAGSGEQLLQFPAHDEVIRDLDWSPDGRSLLTVGSDDLTVRTWDVQTGAPLLRMTEHTSRVRQVTYSPDGLKMLTADENGMLIIRDAVSGEPLRTIDFGTAIRERLTEPFKSAEVCALCGIGALTVSADSRTVALGLGSGIVLLDINTGAEIRRLERHTGAVWSLSFSSDGRLLASASADGAVLLWIWGGGAVAEELIAPNEDAYADLVAFSPDGQWLLVGTWAETSIVHVESLTRYRLPEVIRQFGGVWSPDGRTVLIADLNIARLIDPDFAQFERVFPAAPEAGHRGTALFSPDGELLATAANDGVVRVWDWKNYYMLYRIDLPETGDAIAFTPDGELIITGSNDDVIRLWDAQTGQPRGEFTDTTGEERFGGGITALAVSPDSRLVLSVGDDYLVHVWDIAARQEVQTLEHTEAPRSIGFSPDGRYVLSGGFSREILMWDTQTWEVVGQFVGTQGYFSPDGKRIAASNFTAEDVPILVIYDVETGEALVELSGHTMYISTLAWSPDSRYVVTGVGDTQNGLTGTDSSVRVWDVETGQEVRRYNGHPEFTISVAFSPDGYYVVSSGAEGSVRIWEALPENFITYACSHVFWDIPGDDRVAYDLADGVPTCPQFALPGE